MKKLLLALVAVSLLVLGCAKGQGAGKAEPKQLVVWSFTDEVKNMIDKYYGPEHPEVKTEYSLTPTDQFPNKLDPVLASGQGAPDVFALEAAFVRKYIESGLLLDITDVAEEVKSKMYEYPIKVGTYNGKVYGLSWQVTPGAMFYRRSLAKKYLGTDDPDQVQKYFTDLNKFLETAELLKQKSKGTCVVVSSIGDLFKPFQGARKQPWVVDGKLVIDPAMLAYMDIAKTLKDKGYEGRVGQWSEGWFAGMKGELKNEKGQLIEVFSYFLPTWGLHYVLKTNAPDTKGDWAMIQGPASYFWGGTWLAAYKGTKSPNLAKEFIKYLATSDEFLTKWAKDTGDMVSNKNVVNAIKDTYSEEFLGGQNHYAAFAKMVDPIDGSLMQGTDQAIEGLFNEAVTAYINGEKTKEKALEDFKAQVKNTLGIDS
ncbi:MAG TPA: extracellular solute-binding protein [Termitinemataceae bacterium]|nr:extracellular solute-binding protein [Termitinemataceae bacterium]HOM23328.1 extracellular solute-binding protein [Termitinemataceae bacterium]HPQ00532.1 extracellular solute-binding protein [Termitinemataceae bacterium]